MFMYMFVLSCSYICMLTLAQWMIDVLYLAPWFLIINMLDDASMSLPRALATEPLQPCVLLRKPWKPCTCHKRECLGWGRSLSFSRNGNDAYGWESIWLGHDVMRCSITDTQVNVKRGMLWASALVSLYENRGKPPDSFQTWGRS